MDLRDLQQSLIIAERKGLNVETRTLIETNGKACQKRAKVTFAYGTKHQKGIQRLIRKQKRQLARILKEIKKDMQNIWVDDRYGVWCEHIPDSHKYYSSGDYRRHSLYHDRVLDSVITVEGVTVDERNGHWHIDN